MTTRLASAAARFVALLVALALVATACGGDDGGDSAGDSDGDTAAEVSTGEDEPEADEPAAEAEEPADEPDDEPAEEPADGDSGSMADAADMAPEYGGELVVLFEAESDTWDIPGANCASSCITVMRSVADPMMIVNSDGEPEPFLLESMTSNEDFTEWTLVMRDGVTFHDGTPADGAAVQRSLVEMASGLLQGQVLVDLVEGTDSIELVDDMTVKMTFGKPFATLPYNLSERTGWLIAPSYWDNPERAGAMMIGTGPFEMVEWTRGEQTVVERNESYWRQAANGATLPYLDRVVYRPMPDVSARRATMEAGDADVNIDSFGENLEFWENDWVESGGQVVDWSGPRETTYLMFNNAKPPFDNADMRRALAMCTDREEYLAFRAPFNEMADGPFADGDLGYMADPGFPGFDPDAGNALLDEIGRPEVITYGTTNVPSNLLTAELFADMWSTNCGLTVNIDQFDQSELITKAITGGFEVFLWRNHGQGHPGLEYVWWHSRHAEGLALNFGRIVDADLDALMDETWSTLDRDQLDKLGQEINQVFADNVYNLWLNTTEWRLPYAANVHGVGVVTLESGSTAQQTLAGRIWLSEAWKVDG